MPNFFNYFALVLFFIVASPIIPTASAPSAPPLSPISPTAISPSIYLYIHISICIYVLVSVPTLYINSMIKQKSKTFIIFFLLFFSLVNPNIAIIYFYFLKNKKTAKKILFSLLFIIYLYYIYIVTRMRKTKTLYSYSISFSFFIIHLLLLLLHHFSASYLYPNISAMLSKSN